MFIIAGCSFADPWARKGWLLIIATIPAVVFGLIIKSDVEGAFANTRRVLMPLRS